MRIGAQIGQDAFGAGERGLGVDDPVETAKRRVQPGNGGVVAELPTIEGSLEAL